MSKKGQQTLLKTLKALANPIRLRIIASLSEKPKHAYAMAKELGLSYPLTHLHMKGLKKMGLIEEIKEERKTEGLPTVKIYAPVDFELILTPESIRSVFNEGVEG